MFIYIVHGDLRPILIYSINEINNVYVDYVAYFGYLVVTILFAFICKGIFICLNALIKRISCWNLWLR